MIHRFESNGYHLVLDVNSGAVCELDEMSDALLDFAGESMPDALPAQAVRALPQYRPAELAEAWDELLALKKDGRLFSPDIYGAYRGAGDLAPIKSMCLNVAHDCNLRCAYCFASTGDFGGGRKLMPFTVGKQAIDFLLAHAGGRRNLELDFFGGEPMMNFGVVKELVAYGREAEKKVGKNIRFTTTTNALLLDDEKIDFINREMHNVVLSIDGRPAVHDRMRRRVDGSGSFDTILANIKRLVERRGGKEYYVRGTFTRENLDFSKDVLYLADEGFREISVEPVILPESSPLALRREDLPRIYAEYDTLAREMIRRERQDRGFHFFHFMVDMENGPCAIKLLRGCGCGNEYVAVTPEGDLYPCHQFVGNEAFKMGSVTDGRVDEAMKERFSRANIFTKRGCEACWAKFYCSGGCNANNSAYAGDVLTPFELSCALERKRVECALMLKAALADGAQAGRDAV